MCDFLSLNETATLPDTNLHWSTLHFSTFFATRHLRCWYVMKKISHISYGWLPELYDHVRLRNFQHGKVVGANNREQLLAQLIRLMSVGDPDIFRSRSRPRARHHTSDRGGGGSARPSAAQTYWCAPFDRRSRSPSIARDACGCYKLRACAYA